MPVHKGNDSTGPYYQWGSKGKKYHYNPNNNSSKDAAWNKAEKQGRAAYASGYKGN